MRADLALVVLRLAGLGLALFHGWPKIVGLYAGTSRFPETVAALGFPSPVAFAWMAALGELVGGLGVALGGLTLYSAIAAALPLLVAAFVRHHAHDHLLVMLRLRPQSADTLAAWGNPELALVYLLPIVAVGLLGPGRLSIDGMRGGARGGKRR
jgi:putative oxidoreductase